MARLQLTDTPVLWAGCLAGPVAWVVHLQGAFALSAWATERDRLAPLHALSAACLLLALGGLALAWRSWRVVGGWPSGSDAPAAGRVRYMAVIGMMTGALFACVIVAQWVAVATLPRTMGAG
ncbi:hypothetical protein [Gemmata sp.]|uniref:hypothetical protein n=1 Tax=Gemmata sp. TaxID=1914242 RepID=UPI003F7204C9